MINTIFACLSAGNWEVSVLMISRNQVRVMPGRYGSQLETADRSQWLPIGYCSKSANYGNVLGSVTLLLSLI